MRVGIRQELESWPDVAGGGESGKNESAEDADADADVSNGAMLFLERLID